MKVTAYSIAERFIGIKEVRGSVDNPHILAMLKLDDEWPAHDEVPWCSAYVNYVCWLLRLPRSKSLRARSWLQVGKAVGERQAEVGFDIVVLNRADGPSDPTIIDAPGHVGFFAGRGNILGGNQGNSVSVAPFNRERILGIRRIER